MLVCQTKRAVMCFLKSLWDIELRQACFYKKTSAVAFLELTYFISKTHFSRIQTAIE